MLCVQNSQTTKKNKTLILILNLSTVHRIWHNQYNLPRKNIGIYLLVDLWFGNRILLGLVSSGAPGSLANHQSTPHPRTEHTGASQNGLSPSPLLNETEFSLSVSSRRLPQGPSSVRRKPRDGFFGTCFLIKAIFFSS